MTSKKKNKTLIIGITGGIATGKTTVSNYLRNKNKIVICADAIAHEVVKKNKPAYKKIISAFGKNILDNNTDIDRAKLACIVFNSKSKQKKLENIVHPYVRKEIVKIINVFKKQKHTLVFVDVPLLFEAGFDKLCDKTICVTSPQYQQIERAKKSRNMTQKDIKARIQAQMPLKTKASKADFVVVNNKDFGWLKKEMGNILKTLDI